MDAMRARLRIACVLSAAACAALGAAPARADLEGCRSAIVRASAAFAKSELKALARCEERVRSGKLVAEDCRLEPGTAASLGKAGEKRTRQIARACGGEDRACGGDLAGEFGGSALGWPATCPIETATCGPVATNDCSGVDACLGCVFSDAVDRSLGLAYDALLPAGDDRPLDQCQAALTKASAALVAARAKILAGCWGRVAKGAAAGPCPPHGSGDAKAVAALAAAEARARAAICKACGGSDRACGGGDDQSPASIGFAAACPDVTTPGDAVACGGPIGDLEALVDCVVCTTGAASYCADAATVPHELARPAECSSLCSAGFARACYTGEESTLDVGLCRAGSETCNADGVGFGACMGEVTPAPERCTGAADEDCDGAVDEGLGFAPDLASIAEALVLLLARAGPEGFSASCGGTPAICCPGGNPLSDCGPTVYTVEGAPVVSATATPNAFAFSVQTRIATPESIPVAIPLVGECSLRIDTTAGAADAVEVSGGLQFDGPDPGAGFDVPSIVINGLATEDFAIEGGLGCQLANLGLGFFVGTLTSQLEDHLASFHAEGRCEL